MTIPQLEGEELRQYQDNIEKYKTHKTVKWKPDTSERKSLEAQAQAAWKVCAGILSQHGLSRGEIQQIKKQEKAQLIQKKLSQLEGEELKQYQEHEEKYKNNKAAKWDKETSLYPDLGQDQMRYLEAQAQEAWKVCEKVLLEHGLSKKGIQQIKREAKVLSRERFRTQS